MKSKKYEGRMRIKSVRVNNFKSLVDFDLDLAKFTCLIGLNGAGKSTVLQFLDFLSRLVRGDMKGWFEERGWKPRDVRSKLLKKKNVEFSVQFVDENGGTAGSWGAHYNPTVNRCTWERIDFVRTVLVVANDEFRFLKSNGDLIREPVEINFKYEGSILSSFKDNTKLDLIRKCTDFFAHTESLDLLTPDWLRNRSKLAAGSLGSGGRNLSSFVHELDSTTRNKLAGKLIEAYPHLEHLQTKSLRSGLRQLFAVEKFGDQMLLTESRHLNDGMLRLVAILAAINSPSDFILFDEIENGINPELVEFVIDSMVSARQQVLVTTHSPMILNYLEDDIATQGVMYIYKTPEGFTKSIPFFSIPSLKKKLTVMGPGEAFVDTNLTELAKEIADMPKGVA